MQDPVHLQAPEGGQGPQQEGQDCKGPGLLSMLLSGAWWPAERQQQAGYPVEPCRLCPCLAPDAWHRLWDCPGLPAFPLREQLKGQAEQGQQDWPCFWLRGLLPRPWWDPPVEASLQLWGCGVFQPLVQWWQAQEQGSWEQFLPSLREFVRRQREQSVSTDMAAGSGWPVGTTFYTDGSGGAQADPRLQRFAWGIVAIRWHEAGWSIEGALLGSLPGWEQTINRAELTPLCILSALLPAGQWEVHTDSQYVHTGMHTEGWLSHQDLWQEIHPGCIITYKVKAHQSLLEADSVQHWMGNCVADAAAGMAARWSQVPAHFHHSLQAVQTLQGKVVAVLLHSMQAYLLARQAHYHGGNTSSRGVVDRHRGVAGSSSSSRGTDKRVRAVVQEQAPAQGLGGRLEASAVAGAVLEDTAGSAKRPKGIAEVADDLSQQGRVSVESRGSEGTAQPPLRHLVSRQGVALVCSRCQGSCPIKPLQAAQAWTRQPCMGLGSGPASVGHSAAHSSHSLMRVDNVVACRRCGGWMSVGRSGKSHMTLLARPCTGLAKRAGRQVLARLAKGKAPRPDLDQL